MSLRAVVLGFLGALLLAGVSYFNDRVVRSGRLLLSLMPVAGFGALVLFSLFVQPLLRRLGRRLPLTGRELAVVFGVFLLAAGIPGLGLVMYLPSVMMLPHHDVRIRPGWREERVLDDVPSRMLADVSGGNSKALDGYVTGLGGKEHISPRQIPWRGWVRPLCFWLPLVVSAILALLGLAAVFHTQWARHEQLPYPINTFAQALLPMGRGMPEICGKRSFWWGFGVVLVIEVNNYLCKTWGEVLIPVRLQFDFSPVQRLFPMLEGADMAALFLPRILFAVVALAYFLPSPVSFSMSVFPLAYATAVGLAASYGLSFQGSWTAGPSIEQSLYAGGYAAIALMVLYTGRHYYWHALRRGIGLGSPEEIDSHTVWGTRLFLVCAGLFVVQLVAVGLDWRLALLYAGLLCMAHTVVSRIVCETGAFMVGTYVYPGMVLWTFAGSAALGPQAMIVMFLVSAVLVRGAGWAPMPFFVQALKLADTSGVRVGRMAKLGAVVVVPVLLLALACTLYWQYDQGGPKGGQERVCSVVPFQCLVGVKQTLRGQGVLKEVEQAGFWGRLGYLSPHWHAVLAFMTALGLALTMGFARLRFAWWPFHPMALLFLGGWPANYHYFSFFLGWLIKTLVTRYGGARLYQGAKPLMIGVLAGTMLGQLVPMLVGLGAYLLG